MDGNRLPQKRTGWVGSPVRSFPFTKNSQNFTVFQLTCRVLPGIMETTPCGNGLKRVGSMELELSHRLQKHTIREAEEYDSFRPALRAAWELIQTGKPSLLAIDGRCGSGKTLLSSWMQTMFGCGVIHVDDFYLPMDKRGKNWREIPGGNLDFARLRNEVLVPLCAGNVVCYRPFDCRTGQLREEIKLSPSLLTVVEGSYSLHPALAEHYEKTLFLTCSKEEQARRLREREGDRYRVFQDLWIPLEEQYFRQYGIERSSSLVLDTSPRFKERNNEGEK